ncbi:MAG: S8 family serine peptidase, partial [Clostridia bacterium]|nr:S8 family serine peptidase [Clostridia bacterium]
MNSHTKKFLSVLLTVLMLFTVALPAVSAAGAAAASSGKGLTVTPIDPSTLNVKKLGEAPDDEAQPAEDLPYGLNDTVRVSIFLDEPGAIDAGYAAQGIGTNKAAISYRDSLKRNQASIQSKIEAATGVALDVKWNLTLLTNAISAEVRFGDLDAIRAIPGVKSVELERQYDVPAPVETNDADDPNTSGSSVTVGATIAWSSGYTGAGSRVAIIDTGIDANHQSFNADAFNYALTQAGATSQKMGTVDATTWSQLNASKFISSSNRTRTFVSDKIPYAVNYVDQNLTIDHSGANSGHGSHVAGIAAANRYVKSGDSYVDAPSTVKAVGMAPDAQIFVMKVFGTKGGAYDSDYMVAIEDSIVLGADATNLSLGSGNPGFAYSETSSYQTIMDNLSNGSKNVKTVVSISAGNSYAWDSFLENHDGIYASDISLHTGGSPGTFVNSFCVAASENTTSTGMPLVFNNGRQVVYSGGSAGPAMTTVAGTWDYVYIDGVGNTAEYTAVNRTISLSGKVVIVNRGELSFYEKGNNLKSYNPKALVVANNQDGSINMNLDGYTGSFPMVSISLADANWVKSNSVSSGTTGGYTYYTGSVEVTNVSQTISLGDFTELTDFSSFGVPGSLTMKPEITAPGGNIYSVHGTGDPDDGGGGTDKYVSWGGTSMAAPHIAGLSAVLAEYIRENNLVAKTGKTQRQLVQSLLMSTAVPMKASDGSYQSILRQGSGLANVNNAANATEYIWMGADATISAADGKVKAEIGQNASRDGLFIYSFTINNITDTAKTYTLSTDLFTQKIENGYMSYATEALSANVSYSTGNSVTVAANGSTEVTVTIELTEAQRAALDNSERKTVYVEGFTKVTGDAVEHSIPILGVYGSWTDSSMFDAYSYIDNLYGSTRTSYHGLTDVNYLNVRYNGDSAVKFSGNPYTVEPTFPKDRLAIGPDTAFTGAKYHLIRNAGTVIAAAIKEDGTVLYSGSANYDAGSSWYYVNQQTWQDTDATTATFNIKGSALNLTNGDKVTAGLFAIPEYYGIYLDPNTTTGNVTAAGLGTLVRDKLLGDGAVIGGTFTYDDQAPELLPVTKNADGTITVEAQDDHYIAYLALMDVGGNTVYEGIVPEQTAEGQSVSYTFNVPSNVGAAVTIFVADYAGNEVAAVARVAEGQIYKTIKVYKLVSSLTAGKKYIISNTNTATNSAIVLDSPGNGYYVSDATVKINPADNTVNAPYIASEDAVSTFIWSASSGFRFTNVADGGYLQYVGSNQRPASYTTNTSWSYSNNRLSTRQTRTYYLQWYASSSQWQTRTSTANTYIYEETEIQVEYDPDAVEKVTVTPATVTLIPAAGITDIDLAVKVLPITALDKTVTWSSSNEGIATVDQNGHVTAVGIGSCTVRATSNQDASMYGQCEVSVVDATPMNASVKAQITLNTGIDADVDMDGDTDADDADAILGKITGEYIGAFDATAADLDGDNAISSRDAYELLYLLENGEGGSETQFASIDLSNMSTTKLADSDVTIVGGGRGGDKLFGLDDSGYFHEFDAETYVRDEDATFQMNMAVAPLDAANIPTFTVTSSGTTYTFDYDYVGVTESGYVTFPTSDGNVSYFDFSDVAHFVAITFIGYYDDSTNGRMFLFYAMGADGNMYILAPYGSVSSGEQGLGAQYGTVGKINTLNIGSDLWAYSMTSARDPEGNSDTADDSVFIADNTTKSIYYIDFTDQNAEEFDAVYVGRVSNAANISMLHEDLYDAVDSLSAGKISALSALLTNELPAEKISVKSSVLEKIEAPASVSPERAAQPDAATAGETDDDHNVTVTLSEAEATNNGKIIVTYDAETLTFVDASSDAAHFSINAEDGEITFAYASLDAIAANAALAELHFTVNSCADTSVSAVTNELNEELALDVLTSPAITGLGHDWGEWEETTPANCSNGGEETRICARCNETETRDTDPDPNTHTGNIDVVTENEAAGNCVTPATWEAVVYCADCEAELSRTPVTGEVDPNTHTGNTNEVTENEVAGNCVTPATWEAVVYCADCEAELSRTPVTGEVDPNTHTGNINEVTENSIGADCVTPGYYEAVVYCADCEAELSRTPVTGEVDPNTHTGNTNEVTENEVAGNCVTPATWEAVVYC